jgi:hypothetical protein
VLRHACWFGLYVVAAASAVTETEQLTKVTLHSWWQKRRAQWLHGERRYTHDLAMVCRATGYVTFQRPQDSYKQRLDGRVPPLDLESHCSSQDPIARIGR